MPSSNSSDTHKSVNDLNGTNCLWNSNCFIRQLQEYKCDTSISMIEDESYRKQEGKSSTIDTQ